MKIHHIILGLLCILYAEISFAQSKLYFAKGQNIGSISILDPQSVLVFESENVSINGELLGQRSQIRFTKKYMVYPSIINSANGPIDIDVYWSLGNSNYDCIIDWGNNTIEQFKLTTINNNIYVSKKDKLKEIRKNNYIKQLQKITKSINDSINKSTDSVQIARYLIYPVTKNYYDNYSELFGENTPQDITYLHNMGYGILKRYENAIESIKNEYKKQDSLRIANIKVALTSKNKNEYDTLEIIKRSNAIIFNTFFPDSTHFLKKLSDTSFLKQCKKLITKFKVLNISKIDSNNFLGLYEVQIRIPDLFELSKNNGWNITVIGLGNDIVYRLKKYSLLSNQEFNALCELTGNLHNLSSNSIKPIVKESSLNLVNNKWIADYKINIQYTNAINSIREIFLNNINILDANKIDFLGEYIKDEKINKYSINIFKDYNTYTKNSFHLTHTRSWLSGEFEKFTLFNSLSKQILNEFFKRLNNHYSKAWSTNLCNVLYKGEIKEEEYIKLRYRDDIRQWEKTYFEELEDNISSGDKVLEFKFPSDTDVVTTYYIRQTVKENDIDKFDKNPKFEIHNNIFYKDGGYNISQYTYGFKIEPVMKDGYPVDYSEIPLNLLKDYYLNYIPIYRYRNITEWLCPTSLFKYIKNGDYVYSNGKPLTSNDNLNINFDTIKRCFTFYIATENIKKGKITYKDTNIWVKPTKVNIKYAITGLPEGLYEESKKFLPVMISYKIWNNIRYNDDFFKKHPELNFICNGNEIIFNNGLSICNCREYNNYNRCKLGFRITSVENN